eukprot:COSAG02_NODE_446_length_22141_cov_17.963842_14_plen_77_part_00
MDLKRDIVCAPDLIPDSTATVKELGWAEVSGVSFAALHPASKLSVGLGAAKKGTDGRWQVAVPLVRGAALVTATLK